MNLTTTDMMTLLSIDTYRYISVTVYSCDYRYFFYFVKIKYDYPLDKTSNGLSI